MHKGTATMQLNIASAIAFQIREPIVPAVKIRKQ